MNKISILILSVILLMALFLRFYQITSIPPSLNWDEVSIGYNAYSVFKTGKDEWGNFLPLSFRAFGDYKLPAYIYFDVPFVAIFGLNEMGVRLPASLLGVGFVLLIFLIIRNLVNKDTALWGSFLAAILPWPVILSRIALEAQLALFLTTLGFYLFLKGLKQKIWLLPAGLCLGLTVFSYNSSRIVTPLIVIMLGLWWKQLLDSKKMALVGLVIFLTLFFMALPKAFLQDSSARYRWTTILDEGAVNRINELRQASRLPPAFSRLVYNKATYLVGQVPKNYLTHFSPNFLFINGGSNYQFSVPGAGLIYPVLVPFLALGLYKIFRERKRWQIFVVAWLLIAPIPAALTRDSPHALRSLMMIFPLLLVTTEGIRYGLDDLPSGKAGLNQWIKKYKSILVIILVFMLFGSWYIFWQNYTGSYTKNYSWAWQFGYKQAVEFVRDHQNQYDQVVFSKVYGEPHIFMLFYMQVDPAKYQQDANLVRYKRSDWFWVDKFDKFEFINEWEIKDRVTGLKNTLLITTPGNFPPNSQILKTINFMDGKKAFEIVSIK